MVLDLCIFFFWFRQDNFFLLDKATLFTEESYFKVNIISTIYWKHSFSLHKAWTDGLQWCVLLVDSFGLSFWRHPLTAEDPLLSKSCNATFLQTSSDEETNSSTSWMTWGNCSENVHFCVNDYFKLFIIRPTDNIAHIVVGYLKYNY